ncbi:hypothetical protein QQ045_028389 [Rhodiola kirilowii]
MTVPDIAQDITIEETKKFLWNGEFDLVNKYAEATTVIAGTRTASDGDGSEKNVDNTKVIGPQKGRSDSTTTAAGQKNDKISGLKPPAAFLLSAISESGLVSLPSLLTAVLLQANNKQSSEQSRPDLKMEFFHFMSFLLSHCTSKWKAATDQVGLLLIESLSLLGHFALFHPENQAVLRWGKSPTILHKNKVIVQLELSMDMVISLLRSCKNGLPEAQGHAISMAKLSQTNHKNFKLTVF